MTLKMHIFSIENNGRPYYTPAKTSKLTAVVLILLFSGISTRSNMHLRLYTVRLMARSSLHSLSSYNSQSCFKNELLLYIFNNLQRHSTKQQEMTDNDKVCVWIFYLPSDILPLSLCDKHYNAYRLLICLLSLQKFIQYLCKLCAYFIPPEIHTHTNAMQNEILLAFEKETYSWSSFIYKNHMKHQV